MSAVDHAATGLSTAEAARRLATGGRNELPRVRRRGALRRFLDQLVHFFALMLWVAGGLALVAGLPQLGVAIFLVIVLNAVFAFAQEGRASRSAERLRALLPAAVTVRRDGRPVAVESTDVVVGDVLVIEPGDRVAADATAVVAHRALVDTSMLTGESAAVTVGAGDPLYAGTFLVEGVAEAVVTATGAGTRLADIARLTTVTPSLAVDAVDKGGRRRRRRERPRHV